MPTVDEQLRQWEEHLLQPSVRSNPTAVLRLLADDFREFGSSGRVFDRQQIVEALQTETFSELSISDFRTHALTTDVVLVTYRASRHGEPGQPPSISLRSSLWVQRDGQWQIIFHQGTPAVAGEPV